jgi:hypothetical protein
VSSCGRVRSRTTTAARCRPHARLPEAALIQFALTYVDFCPGHSAREAAAAARAARAAGAAVDADPAALRAAFAACVPVYNDGRRGVQAPEPGCNSLLAGVRGHRCARARARARRGQPSSEGATECRGRPDIRATLRGGAVRPDSMPGVTQSRPARHGPTLTLTAAVALPRPNSVIDVDRRTYEANKHLLIDVDGYPYVEPAFSFFSNATFLG